MPDVVSVAKRKEMMSGIRGKDTKPEFLIRRALHARGFRYRLHDRSLPGHPDLVLPKYRSIVFIHGCFWHMHGCHLFKWPSTRRDWWKAKLEGNARRDQVNIARLHGLGWRVAVVWECALKGRTRRPPDEVSATLEDWLRDDPGVESLEIGGVAS